jgi:hypothetical protein
MRKRRLVVRKRDGSPSKGHGRGARCENLVGGRFAFVLISKVVVVTVTVSQDTFY